MNHDDERLSDHRWKSDFDARLAEAVNDLRDLKTSMLSLKSENDRQRDAILKLSASVDELNRILASGRGGLDALFLAAKVMGAFSVIGAALAGMLYAIRTWPIK